MADFTALKTAIQNAIKQNGNEEITGNLLQEVLLAIVTTLGDGSINDLVTALGSEATTRSQADATLQQNINAEAQARQLADSTLQGGINTAMQAINAINNAIANGCVYAGIATPSSTPASGKVFYFAFTAGTYTNFNSLEVPQGINILKNNGSTWLLDSFLGIDDAPTQGSDNLVKSGGVLNSIIQNGPAFDLSAYNAQGGTLATYADLSAALTALNALPADFKKGGMSMKYVQTSDNKYVKFFCNSQNFTTDVTQWQGVDDVPTADSDNLVKSGGVYEKTHIAIGDYYKFENQLSVTAGVEIGSRGTIVPIGSNLHSGDVLKIIINDTNKIINAFGIFDNSFNLLVQIEPFNETSREIILKLEEDTDSLGIYVLASNAIGTGTISIKTNIDYAESVEYKLDNKIQRVSEITGDIENYTRKFYATQGSDFDGLVLSDILFKAGDTIRVIVEQNSLSKFYIGDRNYNLLQNEAPANEDNIITFTNDSQGFRIFTQSSSAVISTGAVIVKVILNYNNSLRNEYTSEDVETNRKLGLSELKERFTDITKNTNWEKIIFLGTSYNEGEIIHLQVRTNSITKYIVFTRDYTVCGIYTQDTDIKEIDITIPKDSTFLRVASYSSAWVINNGYFEVTLAKDWNESLRKELLEKTGINKELAIGALSIFSGDIVDRNLIKDEYPYYLDSWTETGGVSDTGAPTDYAEQSYLDKKIDEILNVKGKRFMFVTDCHWPSNNKHTFLIMDYIKKRVGIDKVIFGGDAIEAEITPYAAAQALSNFSNDFFSSFGKDSIFVQGNHDANYVRYQRVHQSDPSANPLDYVILDTEIYKRTVRHIEKYVKFDDEGIANLANLSLSESDLEQATAWMKMHYYIDDIKNGIRYIVLESGNNGYTQNKIIQASYTESMMCMFAFIAKAIKESPSNYDIVIVAHQFDNFYDGSSTTKYINQILSAYKTKTSVTLIINQSFAQKIMGLSENNKYITFDFSDIDNNTGKIFCLGGHWHSDGAWIAQTDTQNNTYSTNTEYQNGSIYGQDAILTIQCDDDSYNSGETIGDRVHYEKTPNSVTEGAFTVFTLMENGNISFIRVGAGINRNYMIP